MKSLFFLLFLILLAWQGDITLSQLCIPLQSSSFLPFFDALEFVFSFGVLSLCWFAVFLGTWLKEKRLPEDLIEICASFFILFFVTYLLKIVVGRARPSTIFFEQAAFFKPFTLNNLYYSFPSSHSLAAYISATGLASMYPRHQKTFFIIAFVISLLRMMTLNHFLSDILFGAFMGFITTQHLLKKKRTRNFLVRYLLKNP